MNRILFFLIVIFLGGLSGATAQGIPSLSFELKKPEKFENKKLGSEKTAEKKFTLPRRFIQNAITKFNWHFNASEKLREVIERAKLQHRDDYTRLLSFYNYSLDATAQQKTELDSVIYKANAGILLHDLRNSWIDNLYMLMGEAYYFRKEFDTAYLTFQYINYAFSPKEKDGYDKPIGSNASEGGNAFSISTPESRNLTKQILTRPPSRNESFIWQIRTYLAQEAYPEAAGLIETLRHDPLFPDRLTGDLDEMQALWFYQQNQYDSAARYLEKALVNAGNREEKARWEYLIAQLYERSRNHEQSRNFYESTVRHTLNPVLEVYARLNSIRQNRSDENALEENLAELRKMVRKDRYMNYRDIIYYAAAQMEMEKNDTSAAIEMLLRSTRTGIQQSGDPDQKSKSFLMLGDLSFSRGDYSNARRYYDSVSNPSIIADLDAFNLRKKALTSIADQSDIINRQDSLQRIAGMPDAERETFIRKLVKQLRKQKGLKDEELTGGTIPVPGKNETTPDLFDNDTKAEWYFYNASLRAQGKADFKNKWGNRPNMDNWRRLAAVNQAINQVQPDAVDQKNKAGADAGAGSQEISFDALLKNVPLTPEKMKISNDSVENATVELGKALLNGLEDYEAVIRVYTTFLDRFPKSARRPDVLFNLLYCYKKTGNEEKAAEMLKMLQENFPGNEYEEKASHPEKKEEASGPDKNMTRSYETIYNLFIEGRFEEALAAKKTADSLYKKNYWTPQLLYIESVYYIKQRQDDTAKQVLQEIIGLYPNDPLAEKAKTMINVLNRRKEIENYLTNLKIERPGEDSLTGPVSGQSMAANDSSRQVTQKPAAVVQQPPPRQAPVSTTDSSAAKPVVVAAPLFKNDAGAPHFVGVVLEKVDPVFVNEAGNAFNRYNRQTYYNQTIDIEKETLNDSVRIVLMGSFENAAAALDYLEKTRKIANSAIVPWLPANKFYFIILTRENLDILKKGAGIIPYKKFLAESYPAVFSK